MSEIEGNAYVMHANEARVIESKREGMLQRVAVVTGNAPAWIARIRNGAVTDPFDRHHLDLTKITGEVVIIPIDRFETVGVTADPNAPDVP